MPDRQFWLDVRRALLSLVDAIERLIGICPKTSDLRKQIDK
jgi:hypothetical protein